jgi:hypothetical protein
MTQTRFPDAPSLIAALPVEKRGYPVPFFVETVNGEPDFRIITVEKVQLCHKQGLCWICGRKLGGVLAFVVGPMCAVNRTSAEPPSHPGCAKFAVMSCPFMTKPAAKRRPVKIEGEIAKLSATGGIMIERNPGVSLVWTCRSYRRLREPNGNMIFRIGTPISTAWYAEGRKAKRSEIMESFRTGLPILQEEARRGGPEDMALLVTLVERALRLVPP